jgi:hypothetical protein
MLGLDPAYLLRVLKSYIPVSVGEFNSAELLFSPVFNSALTLSETRQNNLTLRHHVFTSPAQS